MEPPPTGGGHSRTAGSPQVAHLPPAPPQLSCPRPPTRLPRKQQWNPPLTTGSMASPRNTPRTEGPALGSTAYRGGEFVTPPKGTSSEQGRTPLSTLRPMAFDFCNTSDPSPTHHFSTPEAVLPVPGISQLFRMCWKQLMAKTWIHHWKIRYTHMYGLLST
jgi:hypothetical protein